RDLRALADAKTKGLLKRARGVGARFGSKQKARYCQLKNSGVPIQWVVNDLDTGQVIARSRNAQQLYFGASVAKLFVAAAFLDKTNGQFSQKQLRELVRMIVISDNPAWKSLQRQTGGSDSNYAGRVAVQAFVKRMGYPTIQGYQGWMKHKNGTREHGNELNALELARFLFDTYQQKYPGADVLWEIMRATRTGRSKIGKYTPSQLFIGGKTGTYDGPNESPATVRLAKIGARNHAVTLFTDRGTFGISVLANTSRNEDVAILGGGLMREYLGVKPAVKC
ncbi:MAG: serine hydrolase, partial [Rhizobiaceae bacterium]